MGTLKDLKAYQLGFELAMNIFEISKTFPKSETYSLTDQVRRSSRSVCANLAEAYQKRIYPKHFVSKLSDAYMENGETQTWIEFALACKYIGSEQFETMETKNNEISKLLMFMMKYPEKFIDPKLWQIINPNLKE